MQAPARPVHPSVVSWFHETMARPAIHPFLKSLAQGAVSLASKPVGREAWTRIVSDAADHGLIVVLYGWLSDSGAIHELPPALLNDLKTNVFGIAARNLALARELTTILLAFQQRDIPCIPFRGLALAEQLYGDLTARPMDDLDLLVPRESLPKVTEVLQSLGFNHIDVRKDFARRYYYTLEFVKNRHGMIVVEPHWTIAYPPFVDRIDMDSVWQRSSQGLVLGVSTRRLSREDLLLHLCYHLMHWHERAPLLWYLDLDRLIRQEAARLDWAQAVLAARRSGQELVVTRVLEMLKSLFNTPVSDHVFLRLASHGFSQAGKPTSGFLERRMGALLAGGSRLRGREQFAFFFAIKGLRSKLRYALSLLFPSPAFMRFRYGPAHALALPFRYGRRLFQLFREGARWMRDLLFASPTHHRP